MEATITLSNNRKKRYTVTINNKKIHFGDTRFMNYTMTHDEGKKKRYLALRNRENWEDPNTAGFWSRWLLWNKPSIKESAKYIEEQFNIPVKLNFYINELVFTPSSKS